MTFLITFLHVIACFVLIIIVLLQAGKGASLGASMGGAGNQTLFGTSGATTIISKITTGVAILFMLTSLYLAYHSGHRAGVPGGSAKSKSVMASGKPAPVKPVPAGTPSSNSPVAPVSGIPVVPVPEKSASPAANDAPAAAKPVTPNGSHPDNATKPGAAK